MSQPYVVGLTGGIGSGKSAAGNMFRSLGITVVDADQAARAVVEPGSDALNRIAEHFGREILQQDGNLDRAALRKKVFQDESERKWLEMLLHPLINERILHQLQEASSPYAVLESPLLLETSQRNRVNTVVVVDVPVSTQIERYISRDGGNAEQAKAVIDAQMPREKRLEKADYILENTGSLDQLRQQVENLHLALLELANNFRSESPC